MLVHEKFQVTRRELSSCMIERDAEIDLVLTAMVAHEHCLFVGPPGTAKSMLADAVVQWLHGERFSALVSKFSTPEEIFGPVSVQGLKEDRYRRIIAGKLPTCDVAFIDEIFKSSSAILNTMLGVLNERTYRNDGMLVQCPLKICIAASNEWPGDGEGGRELNALFDRFLIRKSVRPIGMNKSVDKLLWTTDLYPKLSTKLTADELGTACTEANNLPWGEDAKEAFRTIVKEARTEGIIPGDRRLRKSVGVAKAYAWLNGYAEVEPENLEVLAHVMWDDPQEQPKKIAEIVGKIANPSSMKVHALLQEANQIVNGADLKDLAQAATAARKLSSLAKDLGKISGDKAKQAVAHIRGEVERIKAATVASF